MVDKQLVCAAITALGVMACATLKDAPAKTPESLIVHSTCGSLETPMINDEIIIRENTQAQLSNYLVAVANIWERELPDDKGVIAPRMSVDIAIFNIASEQSRWEKGFAGKVISLGTDRYCVVQVKYGESSSGSVTLRKIP